MTGSRRPINSLIPMDQGPAVPNSAEEIFRGRKPAAVAVAKGPMHVSSGVMIGRIIEKTIPDLSAHC